jgi:hypothetical protein
MKGGGLGRGGVSGSRPPSLCVRPCPRLQTPRERLGSRLSHPPQDTVTGFLLAGVGNATGGVPDNFIVVDQGGRASALLVLSVSP